MNNERALMKSKLAAAERKFEKKKLEANVFCSAIRQQLNTAIAPIESIDIAGVAGQMDELVMVYADMAAIRGGIERLKTELGD